MKLLQQLVQIKSYSGQEEKLASFIMAFCRQNGIPAQVQGKNIIFHFAGKDPSKALIFNAHLDTVGEGEKNKWVYPPFGKDAGKIVDDKLYGLGASDDKCAIAAMLKLICYLKQGEAFGKHDSASWRIEDRTPEVGNTSSHPLNSEATLKVPILKTELNAKRIAYAKSRYFAPKYQNQDRLLESEKFGTEGLPTANENFVCELKAQPIPLDLWFTFVTEEETDGSGTRSFLEWFTKTKYYKKYKNISAVIGEPTGLKTLEIGHRGNMFIKLEASGVSGHGAKTYEEKELVIEKMLSALEKLKKAFSFWQKKYSHPVLGEPSMNITGLSAANKVVNKIPSACFVSLDIRTTPAFHPILIPLLKKVLGKEISVSKIKEGELPGLTNPKNRIVKTFQKIVSDLPLSISLGSTDISLFAKYGIPAVVFGPGEKEVIHKENEYCILKKVEKCSEIYNKIINNY